MTKKGLKVEPKTETNRYRKDAVVARGLNKGLKKKNQRRRSRGIAQVVQVIGGWCLSG